MPKADKWVQRWKVPKSTGDGDWIVAVDVEGNWGCNCPKWKFTFPRKDCDHIKRVKGGEYDLPTMEKAEYRLAKVPKPKYDAKTNTLLVPLLALPDTRMMEATIVYYMLNHGYTMPEVRRIRHHIPKEWTKDAVIAHVEAHGEAEYPPEWYPKSERQSRTGTGPRKKSKARKARVSLKGLR